MSAAPALLPALERCLGPALVRTGAEALRPFALHGALPQALARPTEPAQVAALLELCGVHGWAVIPWGAGAMPQPGAMRQPGTGAPPGGSRRGRPATRYDVAVSCAGLTALLDHDAENLTVTAQAGLSLAQVNAQVRSRHQRLALGFGQEAHCLGSLVAANRTPPQRLLYGDLRDQVLAVQVALPTGQLVRYGRKVLKNVAGYDMNKLFIGSEGLVGVLTEVTGKLYSLPDEEGLLLAEFAALAPALEAAAAWYRSPLLPACLLLVNAAAAHTLPEVLPREDLPPGAQPLEVAASPWHLLVGVEGRSVALRRQVTEGTRLLREHGAQSARVLRSLPALAAERLQEPVLPHLPDAGQVRLRLGTRASGLGSAVQGLLAALGPAAAAASLVVDYGAGRVLCAAPWQAQPDTVIALTSLRQRLERERGYLALDEAPAELAEALHPWGELGGERAVMALLKGQFDPRGVLAPGRWL